LGTIFPCGGSAWKVPINRDGRAAKRKIPVLRPGS
jgi:hypothetical protein